MNRSFLFLAVAIVVGLTSVYFVMDRLEEPAPDDHVFVLRAQRVIGEEAIIDLNRDVSVVAVPQVAITDKTYVLPPQGTVTSFSDLRTFDALGPQDRRVSADPVVRGQPPRIDLSEEMFTKFLVERSAFLSQANSSNVRPAPRVAPTESRTQTIATPPPPPPFFALVVEQAVAEGRSLSEVVFSPRRIEGEFPVDTFIVQEANLEAVLQGGFFQDRVAMRDIQALDVLQIWDMTNLEAEDQQMPRVVSDQLTLEAFVLGASTIDVFYVQRIGESSTSRLVRRGIPVEPRISEGRFRGLEIIADEDDENGLDALRLANGINSGIFTFTHDAASAPLTNRICFADVCYDRFAVTPPRAVEAPSVAPPTPTSAVAPAEPAIGSGATEGEAR